jgi:hypothetical protein
MKRGFQQTMNMVMALALSIAGVGCARGLGPVGGDGSENDADLSSDGSEISVAGVGPQGLDTVGVDGSENDADLAGDGSENDADLSSDGSENDADLSSDGSENDADLSSDGSENDALSGKPPGEPPALHTVCVVSTSGNDYCCYWSNTGVFLACDG